MNHKNLLLCILLLAMQGAIFAQSPESINYQAVLRNPSGALLTNQNVSLRMTVLQNSASGTVVYQEVHSGITNDFGLINLNIGTGTVGNGNFSLIDWGGDAHFLRVELDETGGTTYSPVGTTQLLSVPYSLYAKRAGSVPNVDDADADPNNELQTLSKSGNSISLSNGGGTVTDANTQLTESQVDNFVANNGFLTSEVDGSVTNELQTLSLSNDTLRLSNGGFVKLPGASIPDPALPVPISYQGSQIFVHPTDNATNVNWATARTTCLNLTAFGFSDWVLPTRLELDAMYKQSYLITGLSQTAIVKYWSDTQLDATTAFTQRLDYGGPDPDPKTEITDHSCRCIRR